MRDRAALILKVICICLAGWLAWGLVQAGRDANPLARVTIPDVPTLPADTNAPPPVANKPPAKPGTNAIAAGTNAIMGGTNSNGAAVAADTNAVPHKKVRSANTNATAITATSVSTNIAASPDVAAATNIASGTNSVINPPTNSDIIAVVGGSVQSNASAVVVSDASLTNASGSNGAATSPANAIVSGTNLTVTKISSGTNLIGNPTGTNAFNSATAKASRARPPNAASAAMLGGPGGRKASALAPEIQARVDRVYESEIFAPIMHPMPMALMGIAGNVAFLRAPNGQTGMVKEGDDLGDIKLLRIGMNRVLVEQDGKKQELMIFAGLGGESLLTKTNESSNETTKH
jgi:hypothetical protein